jgi:hypothetical protein
MHERGGGASSHRRDHVDDGHIQFAGDSSGSTIWLARLKKAQGGSSHHIDFSGYDDNLSGNDHDEHAARCDHLDHRSSADGDHFSAGECRFRPTRH